MAGCGFGRPCNSSIDDADVSLTQISINDVRCIESADLSVPDGLTLVWGPNGSGKTSVLESIYMLGRGRSFRIRNSERLIRYGQSQLRVIGQVSGVPAGSQTLGIEVSRTGTTARIAGRPAESLAELSGAFAVQVIDPGVHRLVEEGGYRRRRWMDWAVFHVEPRFVETWLRYMRALKQRNAALKLQAEHASVWDGELARLGESIAASRQRLVEALQPYWHEEVAALSGLDVELHYHRGWKQEHSLEEALVTSRPRDATRQLTHMGPHRGDITLRLHGRVARDVLSRGQQKLVAIAMTLAQLRLLQQTSDLVPTLLLDDPAAELDGDHLRRFIARVALLRCQRVVTSLHAESRLFGAPERVFCVEQGRVQTL
jgi:DNA replication and repair protein RecF